MTKYLLPAIERRGYAERKLKSSDFNFVKKTATGEDVIVGGFTDFNPRQKIIYSFMKRHKTILAILLQLQKNGAKLTPPIGKNTGTIGFSYCTIHDIRKDTELTTMQTEEEVKQRVGSMVSFMEETAFPLMDKFEDLREQDRIINGEDPWQMDGLKPYPLGGNFHLKRLIIARLAGLGSYERILDFVREDYTSRFNGEYGHSFRVALDEVEELNRVLAGVKPLY